MAIITLIVHLPIGWLQSRAELARIQVCVKSLNMLPRSNMRRVPSTNPPVTSVENRNTKPKRTY